MKTMKKKAGKEIEYRRIKDEDSLVKVKEGWEFCPKKEYKDLNKKKNEDVVDKLRKKQVEKS